MKKFFGLIMLVVFALALSTVSMAYELPTESDSFNNDVFTVVGKIKNVSLSEATQHGEIIYTTVEQYPTPYVERIYEDGSRITIPLADEAFQHGEVNFADEGFPAFLPKKAPNKFVKEEIGYSDFQSFSYYYLIEVVGDTVSSRLIATKMYDQNLEKPYVLNTVTQDENGNDVFTPVDGSPMSDDEYLEYMGITGYNDGLIRKSSYIDNVDESGHYDIEGNLVFLDIAASYYFYSYNLGYFCEVSNNGDVLDWSMEDVEKQRRYSTMITNNTTGKAYTFENTQIDKFFDSGYGFMIVKDDGGNEIKYLVKLKSPAIITVHLNGKKLKFDQIPVAENGRTLVPLRTIFEAIGADVSWDGATSTVTAVKGDTTVKLTLGSKTAYKNGNEVTLDVPAKAVNGRTLVPVRFIADCFDVDTKWVQEDWKVVLTSK